MKARPESSTTEELDRRSARRRRSARNCQPSITGIMRSSRINRGGAARGLEHVERFPPVAGATHRESPRTRETRRARPASPASSSTTRIVSPCSSIGAVLSFGWDPRGPPPPAAASRPSSRTPGGGAGAAPAGPRPGRRGRAAPRSGRRTARAAFDPARTARRSPRPPVSAAARPRRSGSAGSSRDQRVVAESLVLTRIGHDHRLARQDRVRAEGRAPRIARGPQSADARLGPDAVVASRAPRGRAASRRSSPRARPGRRRPASGSVSRTA